MEEMIIQKLESYANDIVAKSEITSEEVQFLIFWLQRIESKKLEIENKDKYLKMTENLITTMKGVQ